MVFTPFKDWFRKGPFSDLYGRYLWGNTPLPTKVSCTAYVASYWAIGCAPPLTLAYYLLEGWFASEMSMAFRPPFGIFLSVLVVFTGGGTFATISSRYRSQAAPLRTAIKEGVMWVPMGAIFFSGSSFLFTFLFPQSFRLTLFCLSSSSLPPSRTLYTPLFPSQVSPSTS
jgi:hypothetical protein